MIDSTPKNGRLLLALKVNSIDKNARGPLEVYSLSMVSVLDSNQFYVALHTKIQTCFLEMRKRILIGWAIIKILQFNLDGVNPPELLIDLFF